MTWRLRIASLPVSVVWGRRRLLPMRSQSLVPRFRDSAGIRLRFREEQLRDIEAELLLIANGYVELQAHTDS